MPRKVPHRLCWTISHELPSAQYRGVSPSNEVKARYRVNTIPTPASAVTGQLGCFLFFNTGGRFFLLCFTDRSDVDVFFCGEAFSREVCCLFFFLLNALILYINIRHHLMKLTGNCFFGNRANVAANRPIPVFYLSANILTQV